MAARGEKKKISASKRAGALAKERAIRRELAALYRLSHHYGWTDLTATHISARLPDDPDHYLINSYDLLFEEITASNLSKVSFDGEMKSDGRTLNLAGHLIHSAILAARPDVNFVMHSHTRAGIAVSAMPEGLLPLSQHSGVVVGSLAIHDYQDVTSAGDECALLVRDLGDKNSMLLRNHGLLCVGRTAAEVFTFHYYLEMSCHIQVDILSMTKSPTVIGPKEIESLIAWGDTKNNKPLGDVPWQALLRMLQRRHPGYDR